MGSNSDAGGIVSVFAGAFLLTFAIFKCYEKNRNERKLAPSLRSVPFLGSLPFMSPPSRWPEFFTEKAKELGPIFSFNLGRIYAVVLTGRATVEEAFVRQSSVFSDRPFANVVNNPTRKGIIDHPYNSDFKKYHQQSLNILKNFGFGQNVMENRIHVEVEDLVVKIEEQGEKSFCPNYTITGSVLNVILSIISGRRYDHKSTTMQTLIKLGHDFITTAMKMKVFGIFPMLRYIPSLRKRISRFLEVHNDIERFLNSEIDAALRDESAESFISHFIQLGGDSFDREQLLFTLRDFLVAGSETVSSTLLWTISILANHPEVQRKLQEEIDSVVSRERLPSLDDRRKLPFAESAISEIMRLKSVVPLGLIHTTLEDTYLKGYFIPKDTFVIPNIEGCHMDPLLWKEPEVFKADRFLDAGGEFVKTKNFIPFSIGNRSCLGESLAQQEIFMYFAGILQNFHIRPPIGRVKIECKDLTSHTRIPSDFQVRFIARV